MPSMTSRVHRVEQHRSRMPGIEVVSLVSNHHYPRHSHDQLGIGVIGSGGQRSWSGIGAVSASAGDVIMVNPGEIHDGAPWDGKSPRAWRMIYFDPALVDAEVGVDLPGAHELVRPVACDAVLAGHFARLFRGMIGDRPDPLEDEENRLLVLMQALRKHGMVRAKRDRGPACVERAIERLDAAPEQPGSLAELAALSNVSRYQLLRSFRRQCGITPHAYLLQRRVLLGRRLLAGGQSPAEAAVGAGFSDQSHMTRAFVRQLGVTPGRYRDAVH